MTDRLVSLIAIRRTLLLALTVALVLLPYGTICVAQAGPTLHSAQASQQMGSTTRGPTTARRLPPVSPRTSPVIEPGAEHEPGRIHNVEHALPIDVSAEGDSVQQRQLPMIAPAAADRAPQLVGPQNRLVGPENRGDIPRTNQPVFGSPRLEPVGLDDIRSILRKSQAQPPAAPPASNLTTGQQISAHHQREMTAATQRAGQHLKHGYALAARGALYSARNEFVEALQILAEARDVAEGNDVASHALASGLDALQEANDFLPCNSEATSQVDVNTVIAGHRTAVCQANPETPGPPTCRSMRIALDRYYRFSHEQLARAAGSMPAGSAALYGLGKVHSSLAEQRPAEQKIEHYRAMAFYEAALSADVNNPLAANELGVLLARYGRYEAAQALLECSVALHPHPAVWRNLAVVYQNTGQQSLAQNALAQARGPGRAPAQYQSAVQWLDNRAFAKTTASSDRLAVQSEANGASRGERKAVRSSAATMPHVGVRR